MVNKFLRTCLLNIFFILIPRAHILTPRKKKTTNRSEKLERTFSLHLDVIILSVFEEEKTMNRNEKTTTGIYCKVNRKNFFFTS